MTLIADDLFAGAGGWEIGAQRLGIHGRGIENMKEARLTRDAAGLETIHDDVWTFVPDGIAKLQIASPPCQTFSMAGKGAGRKALDDVLSIIRRNEFIDMDTLRMKAAELGDDRIGLVLTPLHFLVNYPNYRYAAWEQVPTVQPVWDACADKLRSWGWNVWTGRMQAEQYGVPQTRKRSILIASRDHEVGMPAPTHSKFYSRTPAKRDSGVESWASMAQALGWADGGGFRPEADDVVMVSNYGTGGDASNRGERTFAMPAPTDTPKIDRNRIELRPTHQARNSGPGAARDPRSVDLPSYTIRAQGSGSHPSGVEWTHLGDVRSSRGTIRSIDEPAPTMTGSMDNGNFRKMPGSTRVTVQEAGVLQSFPENHPWRGPKGKQFLQAGNAIPPLLATHILAEAVGVNMRDDETEEIAA